MADQPAFKKIKQNQQEAEESGVKMDDLPDLALEKIFSYLSLEDRIKCRAVSRKWYRLCHGFRVTSLCFSDRSIDFIFNKGRWVSGAFAQNFICSPKFEEFFRTFSHSILSSLKRVRLCDLFLNATTMPAFSRVLNSFNQLQELGLFNFNYNQKYNLNLNLPLLKSIWLGELSDIERLVLDAPKLLNVKIWFCGTLDLDVVHSESVERLLVDSINYVDIRKLKNLKQLDLNLYSTEEYRVIGTTLLSDLKHLEQIHLVCKQDVVEAFRQKRRHGRDNLKIFLCGFPVNGPDDQAVNSIFYPFNKTAFDYLVANRSRIALELPLLIRLDYSAIEGVAPETLACVLNRFTDLTEICVDRRVQDIDRFLNFLKSNDSIVALDFWADQLQELFDRLPGHSAVQDLNVTSQLSDLNFLFRLKDLVYLKVDCLLLTPDMVRRLFSELEFFSLCNFYYNENSIEIQKFKPNLFEVSINRMAFIFRNLDVTIQFFIDNAERVTVPAVHDHMMM